MSTAGDQEGTETAKKKLADLRVIDLRAELDARGLDKTGVKVALIERLSKALQDEGHDPEEYLFEVPAEVTPVKKTPAKRTVNSKSVNSDKKDGESETQSNVDSQEDLDDDDKEFEDGHADTVDGVEDALQLSIGEEEKLNEEEEMNDTKSKDDTQCYLDGDLVNEVGSNEAREDTKINNGREDSEENRNDASTDAERADEKGAETSEVVSVVAEDEEIDEAPASTDKKADKESTGETSAPKQTAEKSAKDEEKATGGNKDDATTPKEGSAAQSTTSSTTATTTSTATAKTKSSVKDTKTVTNSEKGKVKKVPVSNKNLWVSGLSSSTRATDLKSLFSKYGKVVGAKIVTNARTPGARCYGFVTMATSEEASKCIQHLHRTELHGKMISVERTRHEPGGALKRTEAARRLAEKRANAAKATEAKKVEKATEKTEEKKKPEQKSEASSKETETRGEGDSEAKGKSQETADEPAVKDHAKSREKSKERAKKVHSRSRSRERRSVPFRLRRFDPRNRVRGLLRPRMLDRFHKPFFPRRPLPFMAKPGFKPVRTSLLTFQKIKEERLRERQRLRQRELREEERRRFQEMRRHKEIERKQREEAFRLERERERLRLEREKLERERAEVLRLEREKARLERERLEREREELRRREHISRIEEPRRSGTKRPYEARTVREADPYWEDRKRPSNRYTSSPPFRAEGSNAKYHDFEHRDRSFDRTDSFDRRADRVERDNDVRREGRREAPTHEREERRVERFDRTVASSREVRGRERESSRGIAPRERGPPRESTSMRRPPPPRDDWKSSQHDRRVHDHPRDRPDRYIDSKGMSGPSGGSFGGSRSYGSDRDSWSSGQHERGLGRSVGSGVMGSSSQYLSSDRKIDSHSQSWGRGMDGSQGDRWAPGMGSSMDSRRGQQSLGLGPQGVISQPGQSGIFGSNVPSMVTQSNLGGGGFGGDRYIHTMRRY